ncbi:hypothetical protein ACQEWB_02645 [Streptomyces sp. CA-249302]|uniref:hypothetical protein n=1 Tax=Streptomyces sp. CA-249302 TaxID=3240058 RepID=UPI003D90A88F
MGTTLTPEFWRQFAALLVIAMAVTFVLSTALDALYLRAQRKRAARRTAYTGTTGTPHRPQRTAGRPLVRH